MMTDEHWTDRVMQVVRLRDATQQAQCGVPASVTVVH